MERFILLLDNATYMPSEHIQKEKEYGIPWRSAFKVEMAKIIHETNKKLMGEENEESKKLPPEMEKGAIIDFNSFSSKQHFTQPPARYSEATLVKELEQIIEHLVV